MKSLLFVVALAACLFLTEQSCWAEEQKPNPETALLPRTFTAFKTFFKKKGVITEDEVNERFGPPDSHAPLYAGKEEPPSWWYYGIENSDRIEVGIDDHKVIFVARRRKNKSVDVLREWSAQK